MMDLGTLGHDPSLARALNDHGQIVGTSNISPYAHRAALWNNGQLFDLNSLVTADSGWVLFDAYAINNAGQIVCGGSYKHGPMHAVLLTPNS